MKAHSGVDARPGLVHHVSGTAANVADVSETAAVVHGEEKEVYADAGYCGVENVAWRSARRLPPGMAR